MLFNKFLLYLSGILFLFYINMKKLLFIFIIFTSFLFTNSALAAISISPLKFEFDINSWAKKQEKIKVTNTWDESITLYSSQEDFISGDDSWTPKFVKPENQTNPEYSLSNWIKIEDENVTLAPKESREVNFSINVPANSEPGWHYAAIFFSPWAPSWAQVAVVQRIWVLILVNVPGEAKIEWNLNSFKIWTLWEDKKLIENNSFDNFPITFQTIFENLWNVHLKPTWKITLIDENGEVLKNIWKETLSSPAGAYIWEKMVDYIPINDTLWNVLPKSERRFETSWMWFWYNVLNEDGTKSVEFKNLEEYYADKASEKAQYLMFWQSINSREVKKKITANFELSYEWKDKVKKDFVDTKDFYVTYNEKYIWINYTLVFILAILILWVIVYFVKIAPKARAKKEEELKRKIMEDLKKWE